MEALRRKVSDIPFATGLTFAEKLNGKMKEEWINSFTSHWYETKSDVLLQWASETDPITRALVLHGTLPKLAAADPRAAASRADAEGAEVKFDTRRRIAIEWAKTHANAALEWVEKLATGPGRGVAIRRVLSAVAETDPRAAADAALQIQDEGLQLAACADVLQQWAKIDPAKAAAWASSFPPGKAFGEAIKAVAPAYTRSDWQAAGAWIRSLPPSGERDAVIGEYVQEIERVHPADAASWALQIGRADERDRRLKNALKAWSGIDPQAAAEWQARNLPK